MRHLFYLMMLGCAALLLQAGEREEVSKALKVYGKEAGEIRDQAQDALREALPDVEHYLDTLETPPPQESFFGFDVPPAQGENSCQSCQTQSLNIQEQTPSSTSYQGSSVPASSDQASNTSPSQQETLPSTQGMRSPFSSQKADVTTLVFISLSLPEASLKQLAHEAETTGARVVLQGLVRNSFQETSAKIEQLGLEVEIDPTLFDLFDVKEVPTFVRCLHTHEGPIKQGHDRITGNISLLSALEKFKKRGELS